MKFLFTIIPFLIISTLNAQNIEGLWFSSSRMNIHSVYNSKEILNGGTDKDNLKNYKSDTSYHLSTILLNILSENQINLKVLGNLERKGTYIFKKDTIIAQLDTTKLKFVHHQDKLLLVDLDSGWQYNQIWFERLNPVPSLSLTIPNFDKNPYWAIVVDSFSYNYGLEFFILDSTHLIMQQNGNNEYVTTSWGEYKTDFYSNNLYLYMIDQFTLNHKLFRLYDQMDDVFQAQSYEFGFGEDPPSKSNFIVKRLDPPKQKLLKNIRNNLKGSWGFAGRNSMPFYPELSRYDSIKNMFFKLNIDKKEFEISYGATYIAQDNRELLSKNIKGTWKLGATGKYLELQFEDEHIEYLTITALDEERFNLNIYLENPDSGSGLYHLTLKRHR